jgi:hypothetical protein
MKTFSTTNLYNSSRCIIYILIISSFDKIKVNLFIKHISLSYSLWNCKRDVQDLWIMLEPSCEMNKWPNNQNKLCRFWEVTEFCSCQLFHLKSSCQGKLRLNLKKNWILKTTSNGKTTNMKVVGLEKLWNSIAVNVLVWNHLVMKNYIKF